MKRRTKAQKMKAETKRHVITQTEGGMYQFGAANQGSASPSVRVAPAAGKMSDLFHYDIGLIAKDLQKTVVATIFIVVLLIVLTIYLK